MGTGSGEELFGLIPHARYYALRHDFRGAQRVRGGVGVMDAPEVRYARAEDGANIAYSTFGDRSHPAIMIASWGVNHLTLEWEIETVRNWIRRGELDATETGTGYLIHRRACHRKEAAA